MMFMIYHFNFITHILALFQFFILGTGDKDDTKNLWIVFKAIITLFKVYLLYYFKVFMTSALSKCPPKISIHVYFYKPFLFFIIKISSTYIFPIFPPMCIGSEY